jgi:hypothetical protein
MSFASFFAQNQLKSPSSSDIKRNDDNNNNNDNNINNNQITIDTINLDNKLDILKKDILFELRQSFNQQSSSLLDIYNKLKSQDNDNNYDIITNIIDIPFIILSYLWKFIGIIPYLGPLIQLLIIINILCFLISLLPHQASSHLLILVKYIIFNIIPLLFSPLINASKAIVYDSGFVELRTFIGYIIANIKELLLSDMFQGVYNSKLLSSFNMTAASEVLFDGTVTESYAYFKDSLSKLYK